MQYWGITLIGFLPFSSPVLLVVVDEFLRPRDQKKRRLWGREWIFTRTKLGSIYRRKFLCLDEALRVACNSDETQTSKILLLFVRDKLYGEILASV